MLNHFIMLTEGAAAATDSLAGTIGIARKQRTKKEQDEVDANSGMGSRAMNYLLPGAAAYRRARRAGAVMRDEHIRNAAKEEK